MKILNLPYLRRFIAKEWLSSLIALLLAVALWYNVGGEHTVDTSVMVPVEVINLPRELVISNQFKKEIEVSVNGPRALILELENKQITRQIDLSQATPGTHVVTNDVNSIAFPRGIDVLRIQPASICRLGRLPFYPACLRINPSSPGRFISPIPSYHENQAPWGTRTSFPIMTISFAAFLY